MKDNVPLFKSWSGWYLLVLLVLLALILAFWWLTKRYS